MEQAIPKHVAIIMDGNGRWAKKRLKPRVFGHKAGMEALKKVAIAASQKGVAVLTVYAFSTENWSRPEKEVRFIMNLPVDFYHQYVPELKANNVQIKMTGDRTRLPKKTVESLEKAENETSENTGMILNFALNYGGRDELVKAVKTIANQVLQKELPLESITSEVVSDQLMTAFLPCDLRDPDLVIRTSGEKRLSNFLPWQTTYSELYFTDTLWPDFGERDLEEALQDFSSRKRRYGGI